MLFGERKITPHYGQTLTAIDAGAKRATFATMITDPVTGAVVKSTTEMPYDYLHVIPPQRAPEMIRQSGLSWADKWSD